MRPSYIYDENPYTEKMVLALKQDIYPTWLTFYDYMAI